MNSTAVGVAAWAATIVLTLLAIEPDTVVTTGEVIAGGAVGIGFVGMWALLHHTVMRVGERARHDRQRTFQARLAQDLEAQTQSSFLQQIGSDLGSAIELLSSIESGTGGDIGEQTRRACIAEEQHLRQLLQFSPLHAHLSRDLMPVLREARDLHVNLVLHLGETDAADERSSSEIAAEVRRALDTAPRGARLVATIFAVTDGLLLTLTATMPGEAASVLSQRTFPAAPSFVQDPLG